MKHILSFIHNLQTELQHNNGIMPEAWKLDAEILIAILSIISLFVSDEFRKIIATIIAAIKAAE